MVILSFLIPWKVFQIVFVGSHYYASSNFWRRHDILVLGVVFVSAFVHLEFVSFTFLVKIQITRGGYSAQVKTKSCQVRWCFALWDWYLELMALVLLWGSATFWC